MSISSKLQLGIKRLIDVIISVLVLFFTSPMMLLIAIMVKLDSPGPIFFRHRRIGKCGEPFGLYKFRTMVTGGDDASYMNYLRELIESAKENPESAKPYAKMKNDCRVTRVGRFLRTVFLDELPQIKTQNKGVDIIPFWGDEDRCSFGITRVDFDTGIEMIPSARPGRRRCRRCNRPGRARPGERRRQPARGAHHGG